MTANEGQAWVCGVCGYVHRGPEPPENCPICGADRSEFTPYEEARLGAKAAARQWQCLICGHIHHGDGPPETCPVCGALPDDFVSGESESVRAAGGGKGGKIVIVGGGIAGVSAAQAAREASPNAEIVLIAKEASLPYYRLNLTRYLAGEVRRSELPIHPQSWYDDNGIRLVQDAEVSAILADDKAVMVDGDEREQFDRLVITCGSHPFMPPMPGSAREGVITLRTLEDADYLLAEVRKGMKCVIIGGGILGLETGGALARRGAEVTLLETYGYLLPRQLDPHAGELLQRHVAARGISVLPEARTAEIEGDERVRGIRLQDGRLVPADLAIIATGVRSNSYLARRTGLAVESGIIVDSHMATSHPDIFAAGDVAEHKGRLYGLWEPARYQGIIAGTNAGGGDQEFGGIPRTNTLKVLDVHLFSVGAIQPEDGSYEEIREELGDRYYRFLFKDSYLVGAILLGDTELAAAASKAVKERVDFSKVVRGRPFAADVIAILEGLK